MSPHHSLGRRARHRPRGGGSARSCM